MKLKRSKFNEYSGVSIVMLENKGNTYTGNAVLHPEDFENASRYVGCRLAERRALAKYYQEKKNIARYKRDAINSLLNDLTNSPDDLDIFETILNHKKYWNKMYKESKATVDALYCANKEDIATREKLLKRTKEKNQT